MRITSMLKLNTLKLHSLSSFKNMSLIDAPTRDPTKIKVKSTCIYMRDKINDPYIFIKLNVLIGKKKKTF